MNQPVLGVPFDFYMAWATLLVAAMAFSWVVLVKRFDWFKVAFALVAFGGALVIVTAPVFGELGLFGGFNLAYRLMAVTPLAAGLGMLVRALRGTSSRRVAIPLVVTSLLPASLAFYATNIEPKRLEANSHTVPTELATELRIGVIADIQSPTVGAHERAAVNRLSAQQPDLILVAGDTYSGGELPLPRYFNDFRDLIAGLEAPSGVLFVAGDHDSDGRLPNLVKAGGHQHLNNQTVVKEVKGQRVAVLGVENAHASPAAVAAMNALPSVPADYHIVLAHHPDAVYFVPPGVDLVIGGHTHGGQVNVPFFGPILTLSTVPRDHAAGGLFEYPTTRLFVTRGVGVEHGVAPTLRFNAVPEVNVLTLTPAPRA